MPTVTPMLSEVCKRVSMDSFVDPWPPLLIAGRSMCINRKYLPRTTKWASRASKEPYQVRSWNDDLQFGRQVKKCRVRGEMRKRCWVTRAIMRDVWLGR